jgi:hypothetical protein
MRYTRQARIITMLTLLSCVFIAVGWVLLGVSRTAVDWPELSLQEIVLGTTLQSLVILTDSVHLLRRVARLLLQLAGEDSYWWPRFSVNSDILALIVALYAIRISKHPETDMLTYGWKRAEILAAFFNGIFLVAFSVSIIIHSIQRFIHLEGQ